MTPKNCVIIGNNSLSLFDDCIIIGDNITTTESGSICIGETLFNKPIQSELVQSERMQQMFKEYGQEIRWLIQAMYCPRLDIDNTMLKRTLNATIIVFDDDAGE